MRVEKTKSGFRANDFVECLSAQAHVPITGFAIDFNMWCTVIGLGNERGILPDG